MYRRICILISTGLLLSGCTRPYSTSPITGFFQSSQTESAPVPQAIPTLTVNMTPQPAAGITTEVAIERYPFILQAGSPAWLPNVMHPELACNWMGVSGQVFDAQSVPVKDLVIGVGGILTGREVNRVSLTGIAPTYGEGGFEVKLSDRPEASSQALWIQVLDLDGKQLSEKVYFDTFEDCERNLIMINFVQASTGEVTNYFLPIVRK